MGIRDNITKKTVISQQEFAKRKAAGEYEKEAIERRIKTKGQDIKTIQQDQDITGTTDTRGPHAVVEDIKKEMIQKAQTERYTPLTQNPNEKIITAEEQKKDISRVNPLLAATIGGMSEREIIEQDIRMRQQQPTPPKPKITDKTPLTAWIASAASGAKKLVKRPLQEGGIVGGEKVSYKDRDIINLALGAGGAGAISGGAILGVVPTTARGAVTFTKDIAIAELLGLGAYQAVKTSYVGLKTTPEERAILRQKEIKGIRGQAMQAEKAELQKGGFKIPGTDSTFSWRSIAFEISPFFSNQGAVYEKSLNEQLTALGFEGTALETAKSALIKERKAAAWGEAAGLLTISAQAERVGRRGVAAAFEAAGVSGKQLIKKKAGGELFKLVAGPLFKAGFIEGATGESIQEIARQQDINLKNIGLVGLAGGASATVIGGAIIGTKINLPKLSKVIEWGGYLTDPFEKPGDLLQDLTEGFQKNILKQNIPVPTIFEHVGPKELLKLGTTGAKKGGKILTPPIITFTPTIGPQTQANIPLTQEKPQQNPKFPAIFQTDTKTKTPTKTQTNIPVSFPVNVPILPEIITGSTPVNVPTEINIDTNIDIPIDIPADIPANIPTNVPSNVPIDIMATIPINIPTLTPQLRVPPPIPFDLPIFGTGKGYKKKKRTKVINELIAGQDLMNSMLVVKTPVIFKAKRGKRK